MRENASAKITLMETAVRNAKRAFTITLSVKVMSRMTNTGSSSTKCGSRMDSTCALWWGAIPFLISGGRPTTLAKVIHDVFNFFS
jgi:hypothetical protein